MWFIDLRALARGGPVASAPHYRQSPSQAIEDPSGLARDSAGRHVTLVTHGFNVNGPDGQSDITDWVAMMPTDESQLRVGVLWPGDSRWLPVLDYPFEDDEAIQSGHLLATVVSKVLSGAASITLVSHSLGARVMLEAAQQIDMPIKEMILMAAAVDDNSLQDRYQGRLDHVGRILGLASTCDSVLALAFPFGNPIAGLVSRGHPYWRGALGRFGPQGPTLGNVSASWVLDQGSNYGHGTYIGPGRAPATPPHDIWSMRADPHDGEQKRGLCAAFVAQRP